MFVSESLDLPALGFEDQGVLVGTLEEKPTFHRTIPANFSDMKISLLQEIWEKLSLIFFDKKKHFDHFH